MMTTIGNAGRVLRDPWPRWTDRMVAWYRRAAAASDYAERVLAAAADVLEGSRTVIDVGAGFGALALPLARRGFHVTAIEPSPTMARAVREGAAGAGPGTVTVVEAAWGEVPLSARDVVLCARVCGLLDRPDVLAGFTALARRGVVVVRDVPDGQDKFFFRELAPRLLGRPWPRRGGEPRTLELLRQLGIRPAETIVEYSSDQPFESLEEACDFWMEYMELEGDGPRAFLRDFLRERLIWRDGRLVAPLRRRASVLRWPGRFRGDPA